MPAKSKKDEYLGMTNINNQGYKMKIVEYNTVDDIIVEFLPPYYGRVKSKMCHFKDGTIINHFAPTILGIGIVGDKYPTVINSRHTIEYQMWSNMIKRCYDEKHRMKNMTYKDVVVCEEWKRYDKFYEWVIGQENYNTIKGVSRFSIDKDIIEKGNRIYHPDKCTLVPPRVNNLFIKSNAIRGNLPIGVTYRPKNKKYVATFGGKEAHTYLGIFHTPEEAFYTYKKAKENQIKEVAKEEYEKGTITKKCFDAMMVYEVEITD